MRQILHPKSKQVETKIVVFCKFMNWVKFVVFMNCKFFWIAVGTKIICQYLLTNLKIYYKLYISNSKGQIIVVYWTDWEFKQHNWLLLGQCKLEFIQAENQKSLFNELKLNKFDN